MAWMIDEEIERLAAAWVTARSLARGLPPPVANYGGLRVDTGSDDEICRWIFPHVCAGVSEVAVSFDRPGYAVRLFGPDDELRSMISDRWIMGPPSYLMTGGGSAPAAALSDGYVLAIERTGSVTRARVMFEGEVAASGYAAETADAFVYDRIVTAAAHRRKGLGGAIMRNLGRSKVNAGTPELLVATEDGRALYRTLGWRELGPYASASVAA